MLANRRFRFEMALDLGAPLLEKRAAADRLKEMMKVLPRRCCSAAAGVETEGKAAVAGEGKRRRPRERETAVGKIKGGAVVGLGERLRGEVS